MIRVIIQRPTAGAEQSKTARQRDRCSWPLYARSERISELATACSMIWGFNR